MKKRLKKLIVLAGFTFFMLFGFLALDVAIFESPLSEKIASYDYLDGIDTNLLMQVTAQVSSTAEITGEAVGFLDIFIPNWRGFITVLLLAAIGYAVFRMFFKGR